MSVKIFDYKDIILKVEKQMQKLEDIFLKNFFFPQNLIFKG